MYHHVSTGLLGPWDIQPVRLAWGRTGHGVASGQGHVPNGSKWWFPEIDNKPSIDY